MQEKEATLVTHIWKADSELVDGLPVPPREPKNLNKLLKISMQDTTGENWFDMPAPVVTPELKIDLEILKLRSFIDPKRHFKKGDKSKVPPKYFQVGAVVEPASEFFSGRLTEKEKKCTLADEVLSDGTFHAYRKCKVEEINESRRPGGVDKWKIQGRTTWKRAGKNIRCEINSGASHGKVGPTQIHSTNQSVFSGPILSRGTPTIGLRTNYSYGNSVPNIYSSERRKG